MLEQPDIPEEHLRACLEQEYGVSVATLEFLPLGQDIRAGVYRVVSEQGAAYLLKAKSGSFYELSCLIPRYLNDQGIAAVVAPMPTHSQGLWTQIGEWTIIVYPFIEGETTWEPPMTDAQWRAVGAVVRQMHQLAPPIERFPLLRRETFDPGGYSRAVRNLEAQHIYVEGGSECAQQLRASWLAHYDMIHSGVSTLEKLSGVLQTQAGPYVICHADLHPSNIIRRPQHQVFVIDWDDVMLAPKEHDFIFVGDAPEPGAQDIAPFFQGYGLTEIDWMALTYYLWERVIQDVIEYARQVISPDDLDETTRIDGIRRFNANLSEWGKANSSLARAMAHLPALHN
jgi:spectinomycin phosphotransferase